jgi:hypothetical protein
VLPDDPATLRGQVEKIRLILNGIEALAPGEILTEDFYLTWKKKALELGAGKVEDFIIHRNSNPIEQNSIRYPFRRILEKAGL